MIIGMALSRVASEGRAARWWLRVGSDREARLPGSVPVAVAPAENPCYQVAPYQHQVQEKREGVQENELETRAHR